MKKIICKLVLGFSFALLCSAVYAQETEYEYIPLVKPGLQIWTEDYFYKPSQDFEYFYHRFALTDEDTVLMNNEYKKLYLFSEPTFDKATAIFIGGLRENQEGQVSCYRVEPEASFGLHVVQDEIIYDFSVSVGDTFTYFRTRMIMKSIDTVIIDNKPRRKFSFVQSGMEELIVGEWIEGIGSSEGLLFNPRNNMMNFSYHHLRRLRCYEHDGQLLYNNFYDKKNAYPPPYTSHLFSPVEGCYTPLVGLNDISLDDNTSLYPNPAKDVLNITSKERMQRVQVFNMMGQMIREEELSGNSAVLDIKGLKAGVYTAQILFEEAVTAQKFVVE